MDDSGLKMTAGQRDAGRGVHRVGHRRVHDHRARAQGLSRRRPAQDLAVLHSLGHHQSGGRPGVDPVRRQGPNSATCTACTASAHAIGDAYEIIRRGAADAMIAGGSEAAVCAMGVGGFAALRALSTRNDDPAARQPAVRQGSRRLRPRRGRRRRGARGARRGAERAGRGSTPSWSATACPETRFTSPVSRRMPTARFAPWPPRSSRPSVAPTMSSTTSTPTAPRRPSTTRPRRSRSRPVSASTPASWRCRRPSR